MRKFKRIGNLELRQANMLEIVYWHKNPYYQKENCYTKQDSWFINKKDSSVKIHEDCFKHEESCFTVAYFEKEDLMFVGRRPLDLSKDEFDIFMKLVRLGYNLIELGPNIYLGNAFNRIINDESIS